MSSKEQKAQDIRNIDGVKQILIYRGFKIDEDSLKKADKESKYIDVYASKTNEEKEKVTAIARIPKDPQIGVKLIRELGKLQDEKNLDEALLIAEAPLTHYAKKESIKLGIEVIPPSNPLFNIFKHDLVREHKKLNSKQVKSFLERYQIAKHQIPKILENDAAVKAIQAKPGDVIKIIRNPEMGENGAYYRVVIKSSSRLRLTETGTPKRSVTKRSSVKKPEKKVEKAEEEKEPETTAKKTTAKPKSTASKSTTSKSTTTKKTTTAKKTTTTAAKKTTSTKKSTK